MPMARCDRGARSWIGGLVLAAALLALPAGAATVWGNLSVSVQFPADVPGVMDAQVLGNGLWAPSSAQAGSGAASVLPGSLTGLGSTQFDWSLGSLNASAGAFGEAQAALTGQTPLLLLLHPTDVAYQAPLVIDITGQLNTDVALPGEVASMLAQATVQLNGVSQSPLTWTVSGGGDVVINQHLEMTATVPAFSASWLTIQTSLSGSVQSDPPISSVPEPSALILLGSGLSALVARRRRRA